MYLPVSTAHLERDRGGAKNVVSCVYRTGQRFGANHVVDVLLGHDTDKIRRFEHDQLSTYGIGAELSVAAVALVWCDNWSFVACCGSIWTGFSALQLTEASRPLLRGEVELQLDLRSKNRAGKKPAAGRSRRRSPP